MVEATITDIESELWLRMRNNDELVWKTKSGALIPIRNLSDAHLKNILRKAAKQEEYEDKILEGLSSLD